MGITVPEEINNKANTNKTAKDAGMDQVMQGLKAHLKTLGQEIPPEIENHLSQKAGNSAQTIKMASQRMETAQKTTTRLQADIAQQKAMWKRFQEQIAQEYDAQLAKYQERMSGLNEALKKSEEDYHDAKKVLQAAARSAEYPEADELMSATGATAPPTDISPKRKTATGEEGKEDSLSKRLKQEVHYVSDEDGDKEGKDKQLFG